MSEFRIGSLCSGYEGLGLAVTEVLGGEIAWVADNDPGAAAILAHRFPGVPNLGDITAADWWRGIEPVDILTAGFPCQDISTAGRRIGIEGTRSGIWRNVADTIRVLRPELVVIENVRDLLVRGLGRVLADLAAVRFDAEWRVLRASDVGAPHQRARVFLVAWPAEDAHGPACRQRRIAAPGQAEGRGTWTDTGRRGGAPAADTRRSRLGQHPGESPAEEAGPDPGDELADRRGLRPDTDWGPYQPAIARWERTLGRPAPRPTEPGRTGERLSPRFVEWMMGLPEGWVTDVPGLSRNQQLHALGNGVVPQQAALALHLLLADGFEAAA